MVGLLATMDAQTREGAALLAAQAVADRDAAPVDGLGDWAGRQTADLTALRPALPAGTAAASQASLELLTDVSGRAAGLRTVLACAGEPVTTGTDGLGPVPGRCPGEERGTGTRPGEAPSGDTGGVRPGDEPASGRDTGAPAGTSTGSPAPIPQPAPDPAPAPVPVPTAGSGDRGAAPAPGSGTTPVVPDTPAAEEPPLPVPPPLPAPAEPDAPLLDTPLPVCIRPLVC